MNNLVNPLVNELQIEVHCTAVCLEKFPLLFDCIECAIATPICSHVVSSPSGKMSHSCQSQNIASQCL